MDRLVPNAKILERMERAVEKVRRRLLRAAGALDEAGVGYAVVGGNAVAAWVATVDEAAARNTQDVDFLVDRRDFERAKKGLEAAGFVHRHVAGLDLFLDAPGAKSRDAVHLLFAGEKVRRDYEFPAPELTEACRSPEGLSILSLEGLVRMKLTSFRRKDQVHLLDLIGVGLLGECDLAWLPPSLANRLRELLRDPEG